MSTRAQIKITGKKQYGSGNTAIWIYKHHDGYPSAHGMLGILANAVEKAEEAIADQRAHRLAAECLPVGMAAFIQAETADTQRGFLAEIEGETSVVNDNTFAHGDLEYFYEIDLLEKSIEVFGQDGTKGDFLSGTPTDLKAAGRCQIELYPRRLLPDYRDETIAGIDDCLARLRAAGWRVKGACATQAEVDAEVSAK